MNLVNNHQNFFIKILQVLAITLSLVMSNMLFAVATYAAPTAPPAISAEKKAVCDGIDIASGSTSGSACDPAVTGTSVQELIASVINILSWVVGIAAVIMIMIGGFKYIISQGDSNNISSAKNTILYAVIGLVVALFAQLIVKFVINKV